MSKNTKHQASGFFYRKDVIRNILYVFYALSAILALVDFVIHRHIYTDIEKVPMFYAIYGFVACSILVFVAKAMRIFLIRDEDYYDELEDPKEFLKKQEKQND